LFLIGAFRRDPLGVLLAASREVGAVARFTVGPLDMFLLSDPDDIQRVLQDNAKNYSKRTIGYDKLRLALGEGLLTSEGDFWLRQRRIAQPTFHRDEIRKFAAVMTTCTEAMLDRWRGVADRSEWLDVSAEMMRLTLQIIGKTMFSIDLSHQSDRLGQLMTTAIHYVNDRMMSITAPFDFAERLPTPTNLRFRRALREGDEIVGRIIAQRRRRGEHPDDLLSMLMSARDEDTGETMTDRQLRNEAMTFFAAGHETTANALTWTWYLLSQHPWAAEQLRREVDTVLRGELPTTDDLPKLETTVRIVKEAMRLYPPAWMMSRRALDTDRLGGYGIPAGSVVLVSPYVTHRQPELWSHPIAFDPERFSPDEMARRPKFAYFPFGGGPHRCIGNGFAMMEVVLLAASIAQRYELDLDPNHEVALDAGVTLRPKHGIRMLPRRR
jgi:cytochrome P450